MKGNTKTWSNRDISNFCLDFLLCIDIHSQSSAYTGVCCIQCQGSLALLGCVELALAQLLTPSIPTWSFLVTVYGTFFGRRRQHWSQHFVHKKMNSMPFAMTDSQHLWLTEWHCFSKCILYSFFSILFIFLLRAHSSFFVTYS